MGRIRENINSEGKKTYYAEVRLKGVDDQRASFRTKTSAKQWIQDTESAIRDGRHFKTSESKKHTLSELIDRYTTQCLSKHPKRLAKQEWIFNWWRKAIGKKLLSDVTPPLIAKMRDELLSENTSKGTLRTPSTVNRYLAALSAAFTAAVNEFQWAEENPLRKISKPPENKGRLRYLSHDEIDRLLTACKASPSPILFPLVLAALCTGCRQGELLNLRVKDIDFLRRHIHLLETKNGDIRVVPLPSTAAETLQQHVEGKSPFEYVFPAKHALSKSGKAAPSKAFVRAVEAAGIEDFRFHDLRHTTASYLAMNGASPSEIAAVLGHRTLHMVKRYAHLSEQHVANVLEKSVGTFLPR
jgi:integrase